MTLADASSGRNASTTLRLHRALVADGALSLHADAALLPNLTRWLPHLPAGPAPAPLPEGATIDLRASSAPLPPPPDSPPTLRLASIATWIDAASATARLHASDGSAGGAIDLGGGRATLQAPAPVVGAPDPGMNTFTLLTISSALLLARMGRALLHAAAVVSPSGAGWLLIGDTHSGKSTTTLNLVRAGHGYLSDDHVVLHLDSASGRPAAEGWPRTFHVDEGWVRGEITGRRIDFDPTTLGRAHWIRTAPVEGLLFPVVHADRPTRVVAISPAELLTRMVRQSPWFLADRAAAPGVLDLLRATATLPGFELQLGRDSYADPEQLDRCLRSLDGLTGGTS